MPSRVRLRRQLSAARRHIRRVASFVFQGSHIERNRVPVRQFSVRSDHGVQEDSDPDHPNALAAETLDAVARLHALEEEEEDRLARRGGPGRGRGGAGRAWREIDLTGLGFRRAGRDDDEASEDEDEGVEVEEVAVEEVEEQITEDEYEDEDEEKEEEEEEEGEEGEVVLRQYSEEVVEAEIETKATARRSGAAANGTGAALKGAHGPPTPALYYDPRGGGLAPRGALGDYAPAAGEVRESPGGSPGASGGTRGSRAAKQAAIAAIHQLAVSEHPRASM
ncbi:hypothetical protein MNEG_8471 [Monoraphidium neglectum]|uniref:Uncharacterized protein n=1 Tax=Monoraphidium neglectum TaxID=145388 RepID=A0A0D2KVT1_9CHLO|nr:hypothetical protein MNEG_8471 [Monoraphidium neglectum]KIY99488.1 hypothetical protein MNEG_8471 [Monoraphidium neglectum]|eukprot:XP_013898508.1 hypothetical protein MNEG_8471 [Monoraphidium neglectum]